MAQNSTQLEKISGSFTRLAEAFQLALTACREIEESLPSILGEKSEVSKPFKPAVTDPSNAKKEINMAIESPSKKATSPKKATPAAVAPVEATSAVDTSEAVASMTPNKRKARDPAQPKRPPSAYNLFQKNQRSEIKESLGEKSNDVKEVNKAMHEKWGSLSEDDRKTYEEEASKLREAYEEEMAAYNASKENASVADSRVTAEETSTKPSEDLSSPTKKDLIDFSETRPLAQASRATPDIKEQHAKKPKRKHTRSTVPTSNVEPVSQPQPQPQPSPDKIVSSPNPPSAKREKKKRRKSSMSSSITTPPTAKVAN